MNLLFCLGHIGAINKGVEMTKVFRIIQFLFGLSLLIFGLNHFLEVFPLPEKKGFADSFLKVLHDAAYLFPTIALIQIFAGMTLLLNRWVILGLLLLLPVSFNIFAFHLLYDRHALIPALVIFDLNLALLWMRRDVVKPILRKG